MYKTINEENVKLKRTVSSLEQRIDDLEQYSRGNCLEINGIPKEKKRKYPGHCDEAGYKPRHDYKRGYGRHMSSFGTENAR